MAALMAEVDGMPDPIFPASRRFFTAFSVLIHRPLMAKAWIFFSATCSANWAKPGVISPASQRFPRLRPNLLAMRRWSVRSLPYAA